MKVAGRIRLNNKDYFFKEGGYQKTKLAPTIPRFGQGELNISDLSAWNYWSQSDWSHGYQQKYDVDNSKYYGTEIQTVSTRGISYFTNVFDTPGQISLLFDQAAPATPEKTFGAGHTWGGLQSPGCGISNSVLFVGTNHATTALLYRSSQAGTWATVTTSWSTITRVRDIVEFKSEAYIACTTSNGSTDSPLQIWDDNASSMRECTDFTGTIARRVGVAINNIFVSIASGAYATGDYLYKSSTGASGAWTNIFTSGGGQTITQLEEHNNKLYFIVEDYPKAELWVYDGSTCLMVYRFDELTAPVIKSFLGNLYIAGDQSGKLVIYKYNEATLTKDFVEEPKGQVPCGSTAYNYFIVWQDKMYLGPLVTDGKNWAPAYYFDFISGNNYYYPFIIFGSSSAVPYYHDLSTPPNIYILSTSNYHPVSTIESSIVDMDMVGVDKYFGGITIYHEPLPSTAKLFLKVRIDSTNKWETIATTSSNATANSVSFDTELLTNNIGKSIEYQLTMINGATANSGTGDGGTATTLTKSGYDFAANGVKVGHLLVNTTKNSWAKITTVAVGTITCLFGMSDGVANANGDTFVVLSGTTTTPVISDVVIRYILMPSPKRKWQLDILAIDGIKEYKVPKKGTDIERELWDMANQTIIRFEDIDGKTYDNRKTGSDDRGVIVEDIQTMHPFYANPEEYIVRLNLIEG